MLENKRKEKISAAYSYVHFGMGTNYVYVYTTVSHPVKYLFAEAAYAAVLGTN